MPTFEIIKEPAALDLEKTVTEISSASKDQQEKELQEVKNEVIRRPSSSLGGGGGELEVDDDDDDDGFKTPTSMDHKIPMLKQCPPAPRKLKSKSCPMKKKNKRKELPSHCFRIDLSKEIQLLFPPLVSDLGVHKKMKKSTQAA